MKTRLLVFTGLIAILAACKEKSTESPQSDPASETLTASSKTDQPVAPAIHPIAHATAILDWGGTIIYIDPVGGAGAFEGQPAPDLVLVTDIHGDHFSQETLQVLPLEEAHIILPQAVADQLGDPLKGIVEILANGARTSVHDIGITAIPMYNLREEALGFHEKGRGNGYVLEKDGFRVYFSGDTEDIPEMRALENINMAFVCMNLPYTMTVESAADAVIEFAPEQVYPYHYRGNPDVSDTAAFANLVRAGNPAVEVVQLDWYPADPY